jgi:hypothetical protein
MTCSHSILAGTQVSFIVVMTNSIAVAPQWTILYTDGAAKTPMEEITTLERPKSSVLSQKSLLAPLLFL